MHSDYHPIVREREERKGKGERRGPARVPGEAVYETFGLIVPEVLATEWGNRADPDKNQPAQLSAPPTHFTY